MRRSATNIAPCRKAAELRQTAGDASYALASDYRRIAAKRRAETRLLSRAAGLDRYAASLEPAEEEKLPF